MVSCAEAGDEISDKILVDAADDLALSVKAVVQRLGLCGKVAFTYQTDCFFPSFSLPLSSLIVSYCCCCRWDRFFPGCNGGRCPKR